MSRLFRSLPEAPSTLCITRDAVCVCVCVCVFVCVCHCLLPPPPTASSRCSSPNNFIGVRATLTCGKIASDLCQRLHPPCISWRHYVCVCVCLYLFAIACSPHLPLRTPNVHSPLLSLVGGPRLQLSRLRPILALGYIHPVYHG